MQILTLWIAFIGVIIFDDTERVDEPVLNVEINEIDSVGIVKKNSSTFWEPNRTSLYGTWLSINDTVQYLGQKQISEDSTEIWYYIKTVGRPYNSKGWVANPYIEEKNNSIEEIRDNAVAE